MLIFVTKTNTADKLFFMRFLYANTFIIYFGRKKMKIGANASQTVQEQRKTKLVNSAIGGAAGVAIGLGTVYATSNIAHRIELKDEFKSAKKSS